jgi:RHH-type rel operon transcriptional repressor/antitoxin RelB
MATLSIRIPDEILARLETVSRKTGRSKAFYVKEAVLRQLEDIEDIYIAEQRLEDIRAGRSGTLTLDEVERALGLDD